MIRVSTAHKGLSLWPQPGIFALIPFTSLALTSLFFVSDCDCFIVGLRKNVFDGIPPNCQHNFGGCEICVHPSLCCVIVMFIEIS